jgi:hypothetical protein
MAKYINLLLLCFTIILCSSQCKKTNNPPADQLPPITQTGANTFGCLINGNVWLPKGYDGRFLNSRITIDPSYVDGDLTVRVYRIEDGKKVSMSLTSDSIKSTGTYLIKSPSRASFILLKSANDGSVSYCNASATNYNNNNPYNINGYIKVTRYDLTNRIFSGEFEITFNNIDCGFGDPVKITQGRFDYKL